MTREPKSPDLESLFHPRSIAVVGASANPASKGYDYLGGVQELEFSGGEIRTTNFDSYQLTRFSDAPPIEVVLIHNPDVPPQGCGEPAITTVGAALANAIFDAAGARVYTLPMTPERILTALR